MRSHDRDNGNGNGRPAPRPNFGDRLTAAVAERESQIVLGIDPDPAQAVAGGDRAHERGAGTPRVTLSDAEDAAGGVGESPPPERRGRRLAAGDRRGGARPLPRADRRRGARACVAVKPQLACFERLGAPGWLALEHVCDHARERGLLVLADGKRGDVPVTAAAYAQALVSSTPSPFGPVDGLRADAFTANPLLGRDSLEPLVDAARAATRRRVRARPHVQPRRGRPARPRAGHRRAAVGAAGDARRRRSGRPVRAGSRTSAPSPAPPSPSTSRACAS